MPFERIKTLQEYLKENRDAYGEIGIGVSLSKSIYGNITVYGIFDNKLIISDSNSVYILKKESKLERILRLPILRKSLLIKNSKTWYKDIHNTTQSKIPIKNINLKEILHFEQLKFYETFLKEEKKEYYDPYEQVLIGESNECEAYVYIKKHFKH